MTLSSYKLEINELVIIIDAGNLHWILFIHLNATPPCTGLFDYTAVITHLYIIVVFVFRNDKAVVFCVPLVALEEVLHIVVVEFTVTI